MDILWFYVKFRKWYFPIFAIDTVTMFSLFKFSIKIQAELKILS